MPNRTPPSQWGNLFNFAGGGLVHFNLFPILIVSALNPTLFEAIAQFLLPFGDIADRPPAADVPERSFYISNDEDKIYQVQEGAWVDVSASGGGGGSGTLGGARVARTTSQSLPNATSTPLAFTTELWDTDSYHDNSTDPERLTVPADGLYLIGFNIRFDNVSATAEHYCGISINGTTTYLVVGLNPAAASPHLAGNTIVELQAGDYAECAAIQFSGVTEGLIVDAEYTPQFWIERLR